MSVDQTHKVATSHVGRCTVNVRSGLSLNFRLGWRIPVLPQRYRTILIGIPRYFCSNTGNVSSACLTPPNFYRNGKRSSTRPEKLNRKFAIVTELYVAEPCISARNAAELLDLRTASEQTFL